MRRRQVWSVDGTSSSWVFDNLGGRFSSDSGKIMVGVGVQEGGKLSSNRSA